MQFLFPIFLSAAALISVPILIHLFYFRRFKKVYFTNVRFLKELKEETSSRSRIRNLLVLLMRVMATLFLVFAFAQPFIKSGDQQAAVRRTVGIYIDNSFSMSAQSQDVPLLDVALQRAREIIAAYDETDRFVIRTNDAIGRFDRLVDKNTALEFIEEISPGASSVPHDQVLTYLQGMLAKDIEAQASVYLISDFQKTQANLADSTDASVHLVPIRPIQERNISIDTAWFESPVILPGQTARIIVKCSNFDNNPAENIKVSSTYAGETKPIGTLEVSANGSTTDTFSFVVNGTGWQSLSLEISDYPIVFDDNYYLSFEVPEELPVLVIHDGAPNRYISAALESNSFYQANYEVSGKVSYSKLPGMRMIVLDGVRSISTGLASELSRFLEGGGSVVYFPPSGGNWQEVHASLQNLGAAGATAYEEGTFEGIKLFSGHFIFRDVFEKVPDNLKLPVARKRYRLLQGKAETLLQYRDGSAMLLAHGAGSGTIYISSVSLDPESSNLGSAAEIFIPLLFRAPLQQKEFSAPSYLVGINEPIEIRMPVIRGDAQFNMRGPSSFIPSISRMGSRTFIQTHQQVAQNGVYELMSSEDKVLAKLAFNYNRQESDPKCYTAGELADEFSGYQILDYENDLNLASIIRSNTSGIQLWRWALIIGLLFILAEILILRFWKV
jgi:hypothetical protein